MAGATTSQSAGGAPIDGLAPHTRRIRRIKLAASEDGDPSPLLPPPSPSTRSKPVSDGDDGCRGRDIRTYWRRFAAPSPRDGTDATGRDAGMVRTASLKQRPSFCSRAASSTCAALVTGPDRWKRVDDREGQAGRYSGQLETPERRNSFARRLRAALRRARSRSHSLSRGGSGDSNYAVDISLAGSSIADPNIR